MFCVRPGRNTAERTGTRPERESMAPVGWAGRAGIGMLAAGTGAGAAADVVFADILQSVSQFTVCITQGTEGPTMF